MGFKARRDTAYERMRKSLKLAEKKLSATYDVDSRVHRNKDGSIDGELRIRPRSGQDITDAFLDLEEFSTGQPGTWLTTGIRYHPREDEAFYAKWQGMSQAQTFYQVNSGRKRADNFLGARVIHERMKNVKRRKPEQIFVRVNWNKDNSQPERKQ